MKYQRLATNDYSGIMVFAEQKKGEIHPVTYELLGKGRELADCLGVQLSSVILGCRTKQEAQELIYCGADKVYWYDHPVFEDLNLLNYKHNIVRLVREVRPEIFLLGATHWGRSLGARIAVALETGLTADCTDLGIDQDGSLVQIRPAFSGSVLAHIKTKARPQMATVRYKVMHRRRDAGRRGEIIRQEAELVPSLLTVTKTERFGQVNIAEAAVIVSGGSGLKKAADFSLLADLAELLGGVVGSSRPPVDSGWMGREHQVGFSGHTVKPKIYIACGISGSPQHLAGMRQSDVIIAINSDPSAPIFKIADYGIVGDLYEVIPELMVKIKTRRQSS
ncbi:MAG: electron transfer flavoprotein subunit alpha/FixB family protein [Dehalococcoidia bacterium]|nr:MAG: electron transfer flavoprotein subunit alpha/FixB family protein [Dehalococcoidia bacterium]